MLFPVNRGVFFRKIQFMPVMAQSLQYRQLSLRSTGKIRLNQ